MLFDLLRNKSALPAPGAALPGRAEPIPTAELHFVNGRPLKYRQRADSSNPRPGRTPPRSVTTCGVSHSSR